MPRTIEITPQMFRDWLSYSDHDVIDDFFEDLYADDRDYSGMADEFLNMSDAEMAHHMPEIIETIEFLEQEDFFGTEGFEKRYA